jgi:signal peptidase II
VPAARDAIALASTAAAVAIVDQLTKAAIVAAIGPAQETHRVEIVDGWVALEYAENRGVAFGMFAGLGSLLTVISVVFVAGMLVSFARTVDPPWWQIAAIGAIVGGAVGNLVDRIRLGYVVDFVSIGPWPNFNAGDTAITLGVLALIWGWARGETDLGAHWAR